MTPMQRLERELEIEDALWRHKELRVQNIHGEDIYYIEEGYRRQQVNINNYLENRCD